LGESERAGTRLVASEIAAQLRTTQGRICDLSLRGSACRGCGSSAATSTWSKSCVNIAAAKEGDGTQRLLAGVLEIVAQRHRQDEHAAGSGLMRGPVFEIELAGSRDDVLRLLGRVSVPTDPLSWLDPVDDGRRGSRPVSAIDGEGAPPTYGRVSFAPPLWRAAACWIRRSRQ
jgi:hypothetical protein